MAGSLNKACIIGNLGQDPEVKTLTNGSKVVNLSVATSESWKDKNSGERKEKTEWHRVVIWSEGLAKVAEQYLKKGAKVYIEGKIETRKWEKDGQTHYATEITLNGFGAVLTMLDGRQDGGGQSSSAPREESRPAQSSGGAGAGTGGMDDDIPFAPERRG